jgi:hypothetical protein
MLPSAYIERTDMTLPRLTMLCWLIVCSAGCNASETNAPAPTAPGAGAESAPDGGVDPNRGGPTPPRGNLTIRGIVTERLAAGGVRPLPDVNVNAWVDTGGMGYSYWWANGRRHTNGSGQFELSGLPASAIVIVDVWVDGHDYVQQCAAPPIRMQEDARVELQLVAKGNVSSRPEGISMAPGFRSVSGAILENTPAGQRPVPGILVDYEPYMDSPAAFTFTDASGRYLICGIPAESPAVIGTAVKGVARYATAAPGQTTGVDIVFP